MSASSKPRTSSQTSKERLVPDLTQLLVATVAALLVGGINVVMPASVVLGPRWLLVVIEVVLLLPVVIAAISVRISLPYHVARVLALVLLVVLAASLVASLALLVTHIPELAGYTLLQSGGLLWIANVLVFASWYWETDGNGPPMRLENQYSAADFQFPQQENGNPTNWAPGFVDYLFLAFCTATALSPADTVPLTRRAKVLMMLQAAISMLIIVLLVARSVNIIGQTGLR
jgi:uncharacterized membrane protein